MTVIGLGGKRVRKVGNALGGVNRFVGLAPSILTGATCERWRVADFDLQGLRGA